MLTVLCFFSATSCHHCRFSVHKVITKTKEDPGGQYMHDRRSDSAHFIHLLFWIQSEFTDHFWFRLATMTLSNLIFKPLNENVLAIVDL